MPTTSDLSARPSAADSPPLTHISYGVVSRAVTSERAIGGHSLALAAYHAAARFETSDGRVFDFTRKKAEHVGGTIMLFPVDAPRWAHDAAELWRRAEAAEKRCDAQPARWVTVAIPRGLGREYWDGYARAVAAPLVALGMAVQADVHAPTAADGRENPHVHLLATMRRIAGNAFATRKERGWNDWFRADGGRGPRRALVDAANAYLEEVGATVRLDARSNAERGDSLPPEPNVRRQHWERYKARPDDPPEAIRRLLEFRLQRRQLRAARRAAAEAAAEIRRIEDWFPGLAPNDDVQRRARRQRHVASILARHYDQGWLPPSVSERLDRVVLDPGTGTATFWLRDGSRIVDYGDRLVLHGRVTAGAARELAEAAVRNGWTAARLTGGRDFRDRVAIELALREPPIAVTNHTLGRTAQARLDAALRERAEQRRKAAVAVLAATEKRAFADIIGAETREGRAAAVTRYLATKTIATAVLSGDAETTRAVAGGNLVAAEEAAVTWKAARPAAQPTRRPRQLHDDVRQRQAASITLRAATDEAQSAPAYEPPWMRGPRRTGATRSGER